MSRRPWPGNLYELRAVVVHAASQLGISRTTLYKRVRELDLDAT